MSSSPDPTLLEWLTLDTLTREPSPQLVLTGIFVSDLDQDDVDSWDTDSKENLPRAMLDANSSVPA